MAGRLDGRNTNTNHWRMQVSLKGPDSDARRIIIEFSKDQITKADSIEEVSRNGEIVSVRTDYQSTYAGFEGALGHIFIRKE